MENSNLLSVPQPIVQQTTPQGGFGQSDENRFQSKLPRSNNKKRTKPTAVATILPNADNNHALAAAAKLKRRSMNALRGPVVVPRMPIARPSTACLPSNRFSVVQRPSSRPSIPAATSKVTNRSVNKGPTVGPPANSVRPPFGQSRTNAGAKAAAEIAIQKKKPSQFVSIREQKMIKEVESSTRRMNEALAALDSARLENATMREQLTSMTAIAERDGGALRQLQAEHEATLLLLRQAQNEVQEKTAQLTLVNNQLDRATSDLRQAGLQLEIINRDNSNLKEKLWKNEIDRRRLHNEVMELKGNIRVFCRVRPVLTDGTSTEVIELDNGDDKKLILHKPTKSHLVIPAQGKVMLTVQTHVFDFDKVFGPTATQSEVFEEVSQLVQSVVDGYNVSIFAYGQTGSGKTYTMEGPTNGPPGMITLSVSRIFENIARLSQEGWQFTVEACFIEIYNENVFDLLVKDPQKVNVPLEIKMVSADEVDVIGLTKCEVISFEELEPLMEISRRNRAIASTKCNDHSSRSHSIFRLHVIGSNTARGVTLKGTLNLVDLAGSENIKMSDSTGQQLKEAQNINSSLMCLRKVIKALVDKANHVPYRESQLTYLLRNSFGGHCKTLMILNVSPDIKSANETFNSLQFAVQANQCHVGTATKNATIKK